MLLVTLPVPPLSRQWIVQGSEDVTFAVLVAGGAGYVGSATCHALARAGYRPVVIDNLATGHRWAVRWGPLETVDIADRTAVEAIMRRHDIRAVMHFAALSVVGESVTQPERYRRNNVDGTLALLDAMQACAVDTFIFSSTGAVYGMPQQERITEDHPRDPINPYGLTKKAIEDALPGRAADWGLRWSALRYFNAAGSLASEGIGEAHEDETHLIPLACMAALGQRPPIAVMGTDYPTPDGTAIRDYIHVADLAAAHVTTLHYLVNGGKSDFFNLGTGRGHSVRAVIEAVEREAGRSGISLDAPRRAGDPPVLVSDSSKAKRVLGWQPVQSDLGSIVSSALDWHRGQV